MIEILKQISEEYNWLFDLVQIIVTICQILGVIITFFLGSRLYKWIKKQINRRKESKVPKNNSLENDNNLGDDIDPENNSPKKWKSENPSPSNWKNVIMAVIVLTACFFVIYASSVVIGFYKNMKDAPLVTSSDYSKRETDSALETSTSTTASTTNGFWIFWKDTKKKKKETTTSQNSNTDSTMTTQDSAKTTTKSTTQSTTKATIKTDSVVETGKCGSNITYTLYKDGLLELSGSGAMTSNPWQDNSYWNGYCGLDRVTFSGKIKGAFKNMQHEELLDLLNALFPNTDVYIHSAEGNDTNDTWENHNNLSFGLDF